MIIRTITCHHAFNQGAMLQAYALVTYLQSLGHDAKVIDYRPPYMPPVKVDYKLVWPQFNYPIIKQLYLLYSLPAKFFEQKRRDCLESYFVDNICVTQKQYHSIDELRDDPPSADLYIAGSDQIWNSAKKIKNGKDPAFYLDFGKPKRKISYAASFATNELVAGTAEFVSRQLRNFDAISVREHSAKEILSSLGFDGQVVVDPVMLLDRKQWDLVVNENEDFTNDRYILVYDFEPRGSVIKPVARKLASMLKCKIYSVNPSAPFFDYADKSYSLSDPKRFVSLIKHAQCVISNSLHGTLFSMIYGKDFFVINRKDGLNIRMQDLLERYQLTERIIGVDAQSDILRKSVDYEKVNALLCQDIESSKSFLQHQIDLAKE